MLYSKYVTVPCVNVQKSSAEVHGGVLVWVDSEKQLKKMIQVHMSQGLCQLF